MRACSWRRTETLVAGTSAPRSRAASPASARDSPLWMSAHHRAAPLRGPRRSLHAHFVRRTHRARSWRKIHPLHEQLAVELSAGAGTARVPHVHRGAGQRDAVIVLPAGNPWNAVHRGGSELELRAAHVLGEQTHTILAARQSPASALAVHEAERSLEEDIVAEAQIQWARDALVHHDADVPEAFLEIELHHRLTARTRVHGQPAQLGDRAVVDPHRAGEHPFGRVVHPDGDELQVARRPAGDERPAVAIDEAESFDRPAAHDERLGQRAERNAHLRIAAPIAGELAVRRQRNRVARQTLVAKAACWQLMARVVKHLHGERHGAAAVDDDRVRLAGNEPRGSAEWTRGGTLARHEDDGEQGQADPAHRRLACVRSRNRSRLTYRARRSWPDHALAPQAPTYLRA